MVPRTTVPRKADRIPNVHADATVGAGNLLHICRAIDEAMIATENEPEGKTLLSLYPDHNTI
jgi:hypothetical protein